MVRETDLAGARDLATANERDIGDGVVRRPERSRGHEPIPRADQPRDRMNRRGFERLVEGQWRKDPGHAPGHHGLAGSRRTDKQRVVTARGRHFQRAPGERLSDHVGEVAITAVGKCHRGRKRRFAIASRIVQCGDRLGERTDGIEVEAGDDCRLAVVRARQEERAEALAPRRRSHGQHATCGLNAAIERESAEQQHVVHITSLDKSCRGEDRDGNGQVERAPFFLDVGRSEADGDAVQWEIETRVADRTADAIAALPDAGVRQADHRERRNSERHVDFHVHRTGVDAEDRCGPYTGEHALARCKHTDSARLLGIVGASYRGRAVFTIRGRPGVRGK